MNDSWKEEYNSLCDEMDNILIKLGVRSTCVKCSTIAPFDSRIKVLGCCGGCKYLGDSGCMVKSLACKIWVCDPRLIKIILESEFGERYKEIKHIAFSKKYLIPRGSLEDVKQNILLHG